jgi:predicted HD phosphohydrolase/ectoine hydroxylase-related dioxygenase (phytanoyl-CoA dioxygenase family)
MYTGFAVNGFIRYHKMFYKKYGYVILRNQLCDEIKNKMKQITNEIERDSLRFKPKFQHKFELNESGKKQICRSENLFMDKNMKIILTRGILPTTVSNIHGGAVNLFKEKINYKYPNTGKYRAHQDITAYPNSENHITALINLCDTNEENGSIQFSSLCNNNLYNNTILEHEDGVIKNSDKLNWNKAINTRFGDIVLFNSYIPHKSSVNLGKFPRKALYLTYNDAIEGDRRKEYYDLKTKQLSSNKISLINHYDGNVTANQTLYHKQYVIDYILNLYHENGHTKYDDDGSQLEHAFVVMNMARQNNYSENFQLSCFLHDIGHLLLDENNDNDNFLESDLKHEYCGGKFLRQFLCDEIVLPITLHVRAKRYLCTVNQSYYDQLSPASKKSFCIQGGKMNESEIELFKKSRYFNEAIKMREFEDISKKNMRNSTPDCLDYVKSLLEKHVFNYKDGFVL